MGLVKEEPFKQSYDTLCDRHIWIANSFVHQNCDILQIYYCLLYSLLFYNVLGLPIMAYALLVCIDCRIRYLVSDVSNGRKKFKKSYYVTRIRYAHGF